MLLKNKKKRDLSFACPFLVFSISSKLGQVSFNLYRQLPPYFNLFFQFNPANLGGKNPSYSRKVLRQNVCGRVFTFLLDFQTWISLASDIKIKRFKSPNSSTHVGLQLLWRIQGERKLFYKTESGRNLVGKNGLLIWLKKLTNVEHPDMIESIA